MQEFVSMLKEQEPNKVRFIKRAFHLMLSHNNYIMLASTLKNSKSKV